MPRSGNTTADPQSLRADAAFEDEPKLVPAFTLLWCIEEPHRVGETALFHGNGRFFVGRGDEDLDAAVFVRLRPGVTERTSALAGKTLSRRQIQIDVSGDAVVIESVGRLVMTVNGRETKHARLSAGNVIALHGHSGMMFSMRPASIPKLAGFDARGFGDKDRFGIVGESPAIWELRERLAFVAGFDEHVLVLGESGTGKELAARAIHTLSERARGPFVDRSAATLPRELVEAEVFGNKKDYPNPGMPESDGLVGAARSGTLFLDEIGEISQPMQAAFLRVFDPGASYQRLGDPKPRKADVRFVCATNRAPGDLKHDFAARFEHRVELPPLDARREDIPLVARALVLEAAARSPAAASRFVRGGARPEANLDPALVAHLVQREYPANIRDLARVLREAMAASRDGVLRVTKAIEASAPSPERVESEAAARVRKALEQNRWNKSRTADALGMNRYVLLRLMKKLGLSDPT